MSDNTITAIVVTVSGAINAIWRITVQCAAVVAVAYFGYKSIEWLAGKTTAADIAIKFLASVKVQTIVSYTFGGGGLIYGYYQRRLRKKRVAALAAYAIKLEQHINPNRTSSNINPDGTTRTDEIL